MYWGSTFQKPDPELPRNDLMTMDSLFTYVAFERPLPPEVWNRLLIIYTKQEGHK